MEFEKITHDELIARLRQYRAKSGESFNERQQIWAASIASYTGVPTGNLAKNTNMSKLLLNVVRQGHDTVHTHLLNQFGDDKESVVFSPAVQQKVPVMVKIPNPQTGEMQEQQIPISTSLMGEQATKVINHWLHKKNAGYKTISTWLSDGLIYGTGFASVSIDERKRSQRKVMTDVSPIAVQIEMSKLEEMGFECELVEENVVAEETVENVDGIVSYDTDYTGSYYEIHCSKRRKSIIYENIPPEEMMFNEGMESFDKDHPRTQFIGRGKWMTKSDIYNYAKTMDIELTPEDFGNSNAIEKQGADWVKQARSYHNGEWNWTGNSREVTHGPDEQFMVYEEWVKADIDGDGIEEWVYAFSIGDNLIQWEEWYNDIPFCHFSPWPVEHTIWGLSIYEKMYSLYSAKTGVARQLLDVGTLQNTPRFFGNPDEVEERDFQRVKPGLIKVKKTFTRDSVVPVPSPQGSPNSIPLLQYLDKEIVNELGIDITNGTINPKILDSGNSEVKMQMAQDNASSKIARIARDFAEVSLRPLMWQTYCLCVDHSHEKWMKEVVETVTPNVSFLAAQIDGQDYIYKDDLVAQVGLGFKTGNEKLQALGKVAKMQNVAESQGLPISSAHKMRVIEDMCKLVGYANVQDFFPTPKEAREAEAAKKKQDAGLKKLQLKIETDNHESAQRKTMAEIQKTESEVGENVMQTETGYQEQERKEFATQVDAEATAYQLEKQAEELAGGGFATNVKIGPG